MKNNWLKRLIEKGTSGKKPSRKVTYSVAIALFGLLLILAGNLFTSKPNSVQVDTATAPASVDTDVSASAEAKAKPIETEALEESYEKDLVNMLEKIKGISAVEVMVNLDSTNMQVYEKNLVSGQQTTDETDTNGGARIIEDRTEETQTVLVRQGDKEVPLLVHTKKPKVRGVFIIAKGADHAEAKKWVVESVSRVLDVPTHRVSVIPKK